MIEVIRNPQRVIVLKRDIDVAEAKSAFTLCLHLLHNHLDNFRQGGDRQDMEATIAARAIMYEFLNATGEPGK